MVIIIILNPLHVLLDGPALILVLLYKIEHRAAAIALTGYGVYSVIGEAMLLKHLLHHRYLLEDVYPATIPGIWLLWIPHKIIWSKMFEFHIPKIGSWSSCYMYKR